jgi:hypothetical protein
MAHSILHKLLHVGTVDVFALLAQVEEKSYIFVGWLS